mgnify:FL=1
MVAQMYRQDIMAKGGEVSHYLLSPSISFCLPLSIYPRSIYLLPSISFPLPLSLYLLPSTSFCLPPSLYFLPLFLLYFSSLILSPHFSSIIFLLFFLSPSFSSIFPPSFSPISSTSSFHASHSLHTSLFPSTQCLLSGYSEPFFNQ